MRVLWLCNIMLPFIAKSLGQKIVIKEGWLSGLASKLMANQETNDITLAICFPESESRMFVKGDTALFVKDKAQGISHPVKNQKFLQTGGQRRHVLYMPRSSDEDRRYTGEYQISQSALEQVEIEMELPFSFAAMPGDQVSLSLSRLNLSGRFEVVRSRNRMDGDGERTELTLSER